ncbi:hypothetical protein Tco_1425666 [Tanacetum coccineum]
MSTQSSSHQISLHLPNPEKSLQFRQVEESESDNLFHDHIQGEDDNAEDIQMADHLRSMEELLRIPIIGIENAIVVPAVLANEFELKTELLDFVSNNSFFGLENDDPHSHIKRFYQITRTFKINQVPHDVVKLILFSFSLKGAAETWLENEPPNSITSWDDLVSKFSPLHQIDFFYNGLSQSDQDFFNSAAGGNLMMRNIQEALTIIENKAKVRTCRNKPQVSSSGGSSIQNDAIIAFTKQVEALVHHISSMQEAYNQNQEDPIQLMQTQMGRLDEAFQERPLGVLPSNNETYPREERKAVTTMSGLTLDGSFIPHSNFLVYQEEEEEPETITEVVEIASSQSIPLVPPPETPPLIDIGDSLCDKFPIENVSLSGNPTPSSYSVIESLSPLPTPFGDSDSLLEETDTLLSQIDDSFPEYETFCFNIEEISSGSTTSHSGLSLPDYEVFWFEEKSSGSTTSHSNHSFPEYESFYYDAFYFDDDHIEENSSGSTTTHSDFSLPEYDSFIFDLLIDPFPPADRSDSHLEDFADELAHIISPPEYEHFYFDLEDISSLDPPESTLVIDESTLLVTLIPDSKENSLREVERFDPFFSLTPLGEKTRVMETPSSSFHHMPSPRPAVYSPKEVMYRFYHPHLTSGDGFDHGPKMK